mmetsp:Transcript_11447/g.18183  ORF Transcript_11447/g.18183 Transcript_11447/m.18183 type:complete len:238 (-) Transcript_11447:1646-2359(-)
MRRHARDTLPRVQVPVSQHGRIVDTVETAHFIRADPIPHAAQSIDGKVLPAPQHGLFAVEVGAVPDLDGIIGISSSAHQLRGEFRVVVKTSDFASMRLHVIHFVVVVKVPDLDHAALIARHQFSRGNGSGEGCDWFFVAFERLSQLRRLGGQDCSVGDALVCLLVLARLGGEQVLDARDLRAGRVDAFAQRLEGTRFKVCLCLQPRSAPLTADTRVRAGNHVFGTNNAEVRSLKLML